MYKVLFTIGHSTRTLSYFLDLLKAHGIEKVIDIRTIPRSRHNPQFNSETLKKALKKENIEYDHFPLLGGLRPPKKGSLNVGWKNSAFRGYADYMQTKEFKEGMKELMAVAKKKTTAVLCAEAVPWRCHRSLLADAFVLKKWHVYHIQSKKTAKAHELTPFLKIQGRKLIYG